MLCLWSGKAPQRGQVKRTLTGACIMLGMPPSPALMEEVIGRWPAAEDESAETQRLSGGIFPKLQLLEKARPSRTAAYAARAAAQSMYYGFRPRAYTVD